MIVYKVSWSTAYNESELGYTTRHTRQFANRNDAENFKAQLEAAAELLLAVEPYVEITQTGNGDEDT